MQQVFFEFQYVKREIYRKPMTFVTNVYDDDMNNVNISKKGGKGHAPQVPLFPSLIRNSTFTFMYAWTSQLDRYCHALLTLISFINVTHNAVIR